MAVVQLADIYNPLTFARREQEAQVELNAFLASGIMVTDPRVSQQASVGGNKGELPFFKPLGTQEPNYSDDVPTNVSTPNKVTSAKMDWRLASQNQSWSTMDLAIELSLIDPVGAITGRQGAYWATINERRLISSSLGVLADNVANNASDMVVSVATDAVLPVLAAEKISAEVIIDARQTAGDHKGGFAAIAMHSVVHAELEKQQLIVDIRDADNNTLFQVYNNMRVVLDDSLPAIAGTNRITYTSVLFGTGAWINGEGRTETPSEMDRTPAAGNGGGQNTIYSRRADIIHPLGFSFTGASVAGQSATLAELADDANWTRVWERKNVPMAFIQTNG
jgi:hypothetical protein